METYWKSTADVTSGNTSMTSTGVVHRAMAPSRAMFSGSPSTRSPAMNPAPGSSITLSSLSGEYIHAVIQVTRDHVPVVFPEWNLPVDDFSLGIADVTVEQFRKLGSRLGTLLASPPERFLATSSEWQKAISGKLTTLEDLLRVRMRSFPRRIIFDGFSAATSCLLWCQPRDTVSQPCRPGSIPPRLLP